MSKHHADLIRAAKVTVALRQKTAVADLVGEDHYHLTRVEGGEAIKRLGLGFTRAMWMLARIKATFSHSPQRCETCHSIEDHLTVELGHNELTQFFDDMETHGLG